MDGYGLSDEAATDYRDDVKREREEGGRVKSIQLPLPLTFLSHVLFLTFIHRNACAWWDPWEYQDSSSIP